MFCFRLVITADSRTFRLHLIQNYTDFGAPDAVDHSAGTTKIALSHQACYPEVAITRHIAYYNQILSHLKHNNLSRHKAMLPISYYDHLLIPCGLILLNPVIKPLRRPSCDSLHSIILPLFHPFTTSSLNTSKKLRIMLWHTRTHEPLHFFLFRQFDMHDMASQAFAKLSCNL
jgi:hypothetical protein